MCVCVYLSAAPILDMYIYIYIYIYTHTHTHARTYIHNTYIHVSVYRAGAFGGAITSATPIVETAAKLRKILIEEHGCDVVIPSEYVCMHVCMHVCSLVSMHACMCVCMRVCSSSATPIVETAVKLRKILIEEHGCDVVIPSEYACMYVCMYAT